MRKVGGWAAAAVVAVLLLGVAVARREVPALVGREVGAGGAVPVRATGPVRVALLRTASGPDPVALDAASLDRAFRTQTLGFVAPDGRAFEARLDGRGPGPGGTTTLTGHVATRLGEQSLVLTYATHAVFGVIPLPDGRQVQVETNRGRVTARLAGGLSPPGSAHRATAPDDFAIPAGRVAGAPPTAMGLQAEASPAQLVPVGDTPAPTATIDVLAVYSDDLVTLRGDVATAETDVASQFAVANRAHDDSGTGIRFRVVGMRRAAIDPARPNRDVLDDATRNGIAGLDLAALRNELSADLVSVIRPYHAADATCGIAWLNGAGLQPGQMVEAYGFSVVNVEPCGPYVLAHELGHSLGSMHDIPNVPMIDGTLQYGAYVFSFGYRQEFPVAFATVMAYPNGVPWLGRFSDPGVSTCGARCGIADETDNVRSLRLTAPRVEAFRGRSGTLSILDGTVTESSPGTTVTLLFPVRFSGAAPAGGITFDVQRIGGTTSSTDDYWSMTSTNVVIPEGSSEAYVQVYVRGDDEVEPDETLELRLVNVRGAAVDRAEARGVIVNDDPRVLLRGHVRFPDGVPPPTASIRLRIVADGRVEDFATANPPDFEYRAAVLPNAKVEIVPDDVPDPFYAAPLALGRISRAQERDFFVQKGLRVSGRIAFVDGVAPGAVHVDVTGSSAGLRFPNRAFELDPANPAFELYVAPRAWVRLKAVLKDGTVPPHIATETDVRGGWQHDLVFAPLPSLAMWATPRLDEGPSGTRGSTGIILELSAPAPPGGVDLHYRTVDGTARAGEDYTATQGEVTFLEGERVKSISVDWNGDDRRERDEDFYVTVDRLRGAVAGNLTQHLVIVEATPEMSSPLAPVPAGR